MKSVTWTNQNAKIVASVLRDEIARLSRAISSCRSNYSRNPGIDSHIVKLETKRNILLNLVEDLL
jgi:hypothetical protein